MDSNRDNHFHFPDVGSALILALMGLAGAGYLLYRGVENGNTLAMLIAWTLFLLGFAAIILGGAMFIMRQVVKIEERRSLVEQARWRDNATENIAIMANMQKVQNQQNAMLLKQAREAQRALPAPEGDVIDARGFQIDQASYAELGEELELED